MDVLAVVPARGGSKGITQKNIRPLGGRPLLQFTVEAAAGARRLSDWIVSTDDKVVAGVARSLGAPVPFLRPRDLASDDARALPVMQHAVLFMEDWRGRAYDAVMMLQPTTPFRTSADVDAAVELLAATSADSVISVVPVGGYHPARMKYLDGDRLIDPPFGEASENQPRQELRPMVIRNGAIYLTRRDVLVEQGSFKGADSRAYVMAPQASVNIDTEDDLAYAQWLYDRQLAAAARTAPVGSAG
jgi:CMP-N,N'-diacetyllegionaminic acid synthase